MSDTQSECVVQCAEGAGSVEPLPQASVNSTALTSVWSRSFCGVCVSLKERVGRKAEVQAWPG